MVSFPNCKINLGLHIQAKRADGYHNLQTIFYPIPFFDVLEFVENKLETSIAVSGTALPHTGENICMKAWQLLKDDFSSLPFLTIHLHKNIPHGAGLGGGSANGAFMLSMLNTAYDLRLTEAALKDYALMLGSDCPFFIKNKPCFATGRGENLNTVDLQLSGYHLLLVIPDEKVSTAEAFSGIHLSGKTIEFEKIISGNPAAWRSELENDFEKSVFVILPELKVIKDELYKCGAYYASMSGSGSVIFGIFKAPPDLPPFFDGYQTRLIPL